tara:strand:- start:17108 stop:17734 length:627 start_codon:yes stop_codon:yes gene_type:complete
MSRNDIGKTQLYEGVKAVVELEKPHIHLTQQKLYTLFSIGFNYFLFESGRNPGHYIIRVEDSYLLEKLIRKSKDDTSRKFLQRLALPRKFKYQQSMFHLDFFNFTTWANTNDLPKEKVKGALIVKNATKSPIGHDFTDDEEVMAAMSALPKNYYLHSLREFVPKTITIAFEENYEGVDRLQFPFIKDEVEKVKGVSIARDINLDEFDS